jgi:hypothetical protein
LERQEEKEEEERGEEDRRDFTSSKREASRGRTTERWREGGGEQNPKEDQNPTISRGKPDAGGIEASEAATESD